MRSSAADDQPAVLYSTRDDVCVLELNRPRQRNALNWAVWQGIEAGLRRAEADAAVSVVVITGSGPYFSAGGDRKVTPEHGDRAMAPGARLEYAHQVLTQMAASPLVIVAAVEGGAIGIGWSLALACDLVVMAHDAFFAAPFVSLGLPPDGGATWNLVRRLGPVRAADILLSGSRLSSDAAHELGLVNDVCAPGAALSAAIDRARALTQVDAVALEVTKRMISHAGTAGDLPAYLRHELSLATLMRYRSKSAPSE